MAALTSTSPSSSSFHDGMRRSLPLALGVAAFGVVWGTLAGQAGLSPAESVLMSALVFAGAAQFVVLPLWSATSALPLGAIVAATLVVNLRFVLMSATMLPLFQRERPRWPWAKAFLISDENWALASADMARGHGSVGGLLGSGAVIYASWVLSCTAGRFAGTLIGEPARWGLDFAFTASFLALLTGMWSGKSSALPWVVAAASALLAERLLPGSWYIVVGGLCGSLAGAWTSAHGPHDGASSDPGLPKEESAPLAAASTSSGSRRAVP
jgi:4-azaleucine resistance transporter AzlC